MEKESKTITIIPKILTKNFLENNENLVFHNREFIVEIDEDYDESHTIYKFKIGDGITPYKDLQYVTSIYSLFPEINLCSKDYSSILNICFNKMEG